MNIDNAGASERYPDRSIRLPRDRLGQDLVFLLVAALLAGGGYWLAASASGRADSVGLDSRDTDAP